MPSALSYPGVYIEEVPSGVRTITGVATSITAFVGFTTKGEPDKAVTITSYADFERQFGGLHRDSPVSYAVRQFYANGGAQAVIVRVATGHATTRWQLNGATDPVLDVEASSPGTWSSSLHITVDRAGARCPMSEFNLVISERQSNGTFDTKETHRNLNMNQYSAQYAVSVVNDASTLVRLTRRALAFNQSGYALSTVPVTGSLNPSDNVIAGTLDSSNPFQLTLLGAPWNGIAALLAATTDAIDAVGMGARLSAKTANADGTDNPSGSLLKLVSSTVGETSRVSIAGGAFGGLAASIQLGLANNGKEINGDAQHRPLRFTSVGYALSKALTFPLDPVPLDFKIAGTFNGSTPFLLTLPDASWADMNSLVESTTKAIGVAGLGASLSARRADANGKDDPGGSHLKLIDTAHGKFSRVSVEAGSVGGLAFIIQMGTANGGTDFDGSSSIYVAPSSVGIDGTRAGATELIGNESSKNGIYALLDVDLFNLLSIPETFDMTATDAINVMSSAAGLCKSRRAFYLADLPSLHTYADFAASAPKWPADYPQTRNGAAYFPAVRISDPLDGLRLRSMAPSGTVAGIYARTDASRGIWKAPAGTDATMNGVVEMAQNLTDRENGVVNPLGLNVLRSFPAYGRIVWGARTMRGSDVQADEYKYVPVRRLALFLEESLFRGTQWVVFEPNDEPLWSQIRLNIGAFMQNLFRQGAFQGRSPREAYFVKCDRETTTQNDINLGIVNILVGFAPLKPAEFVVLKFQQMAGQVDA